MSDSPPVRLMMVAGEASGDLLGGTLLTTLRSAIPDFEVVGVGGSRMRQAGLTTPYDVNDLSVIGLVEVVRRLPRLIEVFRYLNRLLEENRPDLLITIDLPDFNFLLARRARALGIPVVHYVGPQVWAWRRGRVKRIAPLLKHLMVLFPFEPAYWQKTDLPVTFVGHPLVQQAVPKTPRDETRRKLGVAEDEKLVVVLPGSRKGEIQRLLGVMTEACQELQQRQPKTRFVLALADTLTPEEAPWPWQVIQGGTYDLLAAADAAMVASGTATLETALLGTPMVVVYQVNRITYEIGRRVIRVPFISLANLVWEGGLVTERIQDQARPQILAGDLETLLTDSEERQRLQRGYHQIRERLSNPDRQAVDVILEILQKLRPKLEIQAWQALR
ncbi:MAG: lipid-A-disaccharide synthase [Magnetococcales bacterium]|nr:lipid-A-disaccharide synthase [Magnetococcales bacterium]